MKIRHWIRWTLGSCAIALLFANWVIRYEPTPTATPDGVVATTADDADRVGGPRLVNQDWYIRNMATAHGAFVIEVEAVDLSKTEVIARALVEPIRDRYDEILVYVNKLGDKSDLPSRRMQWTSAKGYVETVYDQPGP